MHHIVEALLYLQEKKTPESFFWLEVMSPKPAVRFFRKKSAFQTFDAYSSCLYEDTLAVKSIKRLNKQNCQRSSCTVGKVVSRSWQRRKKKISILIHL